MKQAVISVSIEITNCYKNCIFAILKFYFIFISIKRI